VTFWTDALALLDRISAPKTAHAHCDIPCGIYDPHAAQIAALTVIRMVQLMDGLAPPNGGDKAALTTYAMQMARYTMVKEEHARIVESELDTLWSDYFKPEHLAQYPNLHEKFWQATKLSSAARQQASMDTAQQLLAATQEIAEMFWQSKGVQTKRLPSNQGAVGGEIVYPA
jgi:nickel superoxide dismutase